MTTTKEGFEDLPILTELRDSLNGAFAAAESPCSPVSVREATRPRRARRSRRRRLALAGAVTAAGLGAAAAGVFGFQGGHLAPSSAVAATMNKLAHVAVSQDWGGVPGPGQYIYFESEYQQAGYPLEQQQSWLSSDGVWLASNPRTEKNNGQVVSSGGPGSGTYFPTTVAGWQALSTDPATLLAQLKQIDAPGAANTPAEQFTVVGDTLNGTSAPQAVRALVFQAVALIPGVKLMGTQTDPTGQQGIGVGYYSNGTLQSELIIDPSTSRLLGELDYDQNGNITFAASDIQQTLVNNAPAAGAMPPTVQFPPFRTTVATTGNSGNTGS